MNTQGIDLEEFLNSVEIDEDATQSSAIATEIYATGYEDALTEVAAYLKLNLTELREGLLRYSMQKEIKV